MQESTYPNFLDPSTIAKLGGIERIAAITTDILHEYEIPRPLLTRCEIERLSYRQELLTHGIRFCYDDCRSVSANVADIIAQATEIQKNSGGANFVGAMLQHLVGAKLDIVLGLGAVSHHGASVADGPTVRQGDFEVNGVAIHVTTHPGEALIRKAAKNLQAGLKPVIVTLADGVEGAAYLLKNTEWKDRIDVIDATQFLTANVYERSLFKAQDCKATLSSILTRYNEIVTECENDPVLLIRF